MAEPRNRNGKANSPLPADDVVVGHLLTHAGMGGAENYVVLLANAHAARGGGSQVVVLEGAGPISERFTEDVGVSYHNYQRASIRNPLRFVGSLIRGYRLLSGAVRRQGIEVLQTHLPDTNLWGLVLSLSGVCKVVITIHNNKFLNNVGGTSLGQFFKLKAYRLMIRRCAAVVTVSAEVRRSLLTTLGIGEKEAGKVVVVDNGVPIPDPPPPQRRAALRREYAVSEEQCWIVAAGRLTEAKNFQCLVAAAALLRDEGLPVRVLIGGEGHLRDDLEEQIADLGLQEVVDLPGNLQNLGEIMQAADLLAMPSRWEGLPLVLLEALARGLPVVGTRINGLVDIVADGEHGHLVPVDDSEALARSLKSLIIDPDLRHRMGAQCVGLVRRRFDFQRVYDELAAVYERAGS